jgi:hypothetical protein
MRIRTRLVFAALVSAALMGGALAALASSHREAPGIANYPALDNTDLYAFVSPDQPSTVTFIGNWWPFAEPSGGPNFYAFDDDAVYTIRVDNVGDARDHIVYEFRFKTEIRNGNTFLYNTGPITSLDDPDWNVRQFYSVTRWENGRSKVLGRNLPVAPARVGPASTPDYAALAATAVKTLSDGSRVFVGPRDDPFFVDLGGTFDLLTIRRVPGNQGLGVDGLGGFNVLAIALQVPKSELIRERRDGKDDKGGKEVNSIIGVYTTTERDRSGRDELGSRRTGRDDDRDRIVVSRLGSPLVNEVVIPLKDKDRWNQSSPRRDAQFLDYVVRPELPGLLNALYGISVPGGPRNDLVAVFLTGVPGLNQPARGVPGEFLRLNLAIAPSATPSRLGVLGGDLAGFPNGRRLADDVVDIELRAVAGVLVEGFDVAPNNQLGDGVDVNDRDFLAVFPYAALPHDGLSHDHHRAEPGHPAGAAVQVEPISAGEQIVEVESQDLALDPAAEPGLRLAGPNPGARHDLQYTLHRGARVTLRIYDVQGREIRTLVDRDAAPGTFRATWDGRSRDGSSAGQGVFFARFTMDGAVVNIKKLVVR